MELAEVAVIFGILISLWIVLARDFEKGLAYAVFWCVWMTTFLRVETHGVLPELTIHRLILLTLFVFWFKKPEYRARLRSTPFVGAFAFFACISFLSLLGTSIDFGDSLKAYLDVIAEVGVFFVIIMTTLRRREDAVRVLRAAALGISIVAALAVIEHYTRFNPVDEFIPNYERAEGTGHDVMSTYQHRILLGTGVGMGFCVCLALLMLGERKFPGKKTLWASMALCLSASFFAQSRGPWIACAFGTGVIVWLGSAKVRKRLLMLGAVAAVGLLFKPGVITSVTGYAEDTLDSDSFKGGTFQYRLELWKIAWNEVTSSPQRFLLGYGPGSGRGVDLEWNLSYRNRDMKIESWDNQFAYDLFRYGVIGAIASVNLFIGTWWRLFKLAKVSRRENRDTVAALLGAVTALVFMMSNVFIFARQLDYFFWAVVAAMIVLVGYYEEPKAALEAMDLPENHEPARAAEFVAP